jgi:CYTH domain-containing protein/CHAD domain-containing protein
MSSEIERKFLLEGLPEGLAGRPGEAISQGYLTDGESAEVRLRRAGERTLMTVKTGSGEVREQVEIELAPALWDSLWPLTEGRRIAKTRLRQPLEAGLTAEVDVYEGELSGLVVAEVEFESTAASRGFEPPAWLGEEVTGDPAYSNRALASDGTSAAPAAATAAREKPSRGFRFKHGEEIGEGVARIARGRAEKAIEALDAADRDPAEAIHSARKDLKKLRSLLRLVRAELPKKAYRAESRRYRDAGRELSASRDAEVKVETLAALEERFGAELPSASAGGWRRLLEAERDAGAGTAVDPATEQAAAREHLAAGLEAVDRWAPAGDSWELIGPGLRRGYGRGRAAMARLAEDHDPELVHEWRKRAKDLWYQLRLLRKAWPELLEETVERTHELTDLLGDHHDLTVLAADLAQRPEVGSRERLGELIERRQAELLDAALELGARLYAEQPKAFERRLRAYWSAWR